MEDDNESSLIYQLGACEEKCSVLSLKANSRLIKDLQGVKNEAWIEFTSTTSARVTIGNEVYELSFCDTKPTDAYVQEDWIQMARLGEVQGRLQVTSSKSGGVKESVVSATVEKLNLYPEPESKKREISLLDIGANNIPPSHNPDSNSNKKAKISHAASIATSSNATTPRRKPVLAYTEPAQIVAAQPTFDLTSPVLLLGNVPVEVSAGDVLSTLFSGLSIAAMYACNPKHVSLSHADADVGYSSSTVQASSTVDLYVEFNFIGGAELAMMRDGEELSYKSLNALVSSTVSIPDNTSNSNTQNTSSMSGSSSMNTPAKNTYTRKQFAPHVQPVDQQLAFWAKSVGVKLCTTASTAGQCLTTNTPIRKYIEVLLDALQSVNHTKHINTAGTTNNGGNDGSITVSNVLCDPVALARHWQEVVGQLLLPQGRMDAYSANFTCTVRILKDTEYLHRNPAVEDMLCAHLAQCHSSGSSGGSGGSGGRSGSSGSRGAAGNGGFLCDEGGDGLYSVENDASHRHYDKLVREAEQRVLQYSALWCALSLSIAPVRSAVKSTTASEVAAVVPVDGSGRFVCDLVTTRLAMYKALYKQAWSLSTTYSVLR